MRGEAPSQSSGLLICVLGDGRAWLAREEKTPLLGYGFGHVGGRDQDRSPSKQANPYLERLRLGGVAEADAAYVADPAAGSLYLETLAAAKPVVEPEARLPCSASSTAFPRPRLITQQPPLRRVYPLAARAIALASKVLASCAFRRAPSGERESSVGLGVRLPLRPLALTPAEQRS
jgi:hypothetical protein